MSMRIHANLPFMSTRILPPILNAIILINIKIFCWNGKSGIMWTSHNGLELFLFAWTWKNADLEGNLSFWVKWWNSGYSGLWQYSDILSKKKVMFSLASIMNSPTLLLFQFSPDNCIEHVTNSFLFYDFFCLHFAQFL